MKPWPVAHIPIYNLAIQIESGSINTCENAIRSYQILAPRGIRRIILVTSACTCLGRPELFARRASKSSRRRPDFRTGWGEANMVERWLPSANNVLASDAALHEWLGIAIYRLRGWM